jgi:NAD(P)-dependent dehydrogenase (short-subunit alcohol dehydrogenase family)
MNKIPKVAIVTGAGSGIGKHSALALIEGGWSVVLAGRREDALLTSAQESGIDAARVLAVPTDVTDPESVQNLFDRTKETFGRLDLLFNNAGINLPGAEIDEFTFDQWQRIVAVNLTGVFLCTQAAFRMMKTQEPQGGRIINNGSISAHTPRPGAVSYTTTKHAITGLTKQTALDCRKFDINCGQIDIGNAATPLTERMVAGVLQPDGSVMAEARMNADDVGRAVVYMASLPLDTNVLFMTVMASKMPFVGRG